MRKELRKYRFLWCLALLALPLSAWSDTLILKDGRVFQGRYLGGSSDRIIFGVNGETQVIFVSSVITLTFDEATERMLSAGAPADPAPAPPVVPARKKLIVPVGTRLKVRTDTPLASDEVDTGYRFSATLEGDIVSGGVVVIPKGSKVYGRVIEASGGKRLVGRAKLVIELTDVAINDQLQPVMTDKFGVEGPEEAGGTAAKIGAGTLIGAVLDGKSGAAKGAAVGGGVSLLTKGKHVQIPAQTVLEFRLQQPMVFQVK